MTTTPTESAAMTAIDHNPTLDLRFERQTDLPPEALWAAWTQPALLMAWFCPRPWTTIACEIDLQPGGLFRTVMRSPEGEECPNIGSYLEVVPNRRLVWTNALAPGFRPAPSDAVANFFFFTAIISLTPENGGTRYQARVLHGTADDCRKHAEMGFEAGWGQAFEQLVELMKSPGN